MPRPTSRRSARSRAKGMQRRGRKMASPADAKLPNTAGKENAEGANVDKIRDILFGSQMRDYEKRFMRLEDTVTKAIDDAARRYHQALRYAERLHAGGSRVAEPARENRKVRAQRKHKEIAREMKDGAKVHREKTLGARRADVRRPQRTARETVRAFQEPLPPKSKSTAATPPPHSTAKSRDAAPRKDGPRRSGRFVGRIFAAP